MCAGIENSECFLVGLTLWTCFFNDLLANNIFRKLFWTGVIRSKRSKNVWIPRLNLMKLNARAPSTDQQPGIVCSMLGAVWCKCRIETVCFSSVFLNFFFWFLFCFMWAPLLFLPHSQKPFFSLQIHNTIYFYFILFHILFVISVAVILVVVRGVYIDNHRRIYGAQIPKQPKRTTKK